MTHLTTMTSHATTDADRVVFAQQAAERAATRLRKPTLSDLDLAVAAEELTSALAWLRRAGAPMPVRMLTSLAL